VTVLDDAHRASTDENEGTVRCPFCDATTVSTIASFGSQLLMSQFRCNACRSYFEGVRLDRYEATEAGPPRPSPPGLS
jgi:transposase-like protein